MAIEPTMQIFKNYIHVYTVSIIYTVQVHRYSNSFCNIIHRITVTGLFDVGKENTSV